MINFWKSATSGSTNFKDSLTLRDTDFPQFVAHVYVWKTGRIFLKILLDVSLVKKVTITSGDHPELDLGGVCALQMLLFT